MPTDDERKIAEIQNKRREGRARLSAIRDVSRWNLIAIGPKIAKLVRAA